MTLKITDSESATIANGGTVCITTKRIEASVVLRIKLPQDEATMNADGAIQLTRLQEWLETSLRLTNAALNRLQRNPNPKD